ncbi:Ribonuclease D [bacterium HR40]|nr:Ribonuclease D [bacterium HR40]
MLLTTTGELRAFVIAAREEPWIAVDTEFMRDRTYYPRLCLVQLASSKAAVAVDPLAEGIDLAPLADLLLDPGVTKVFHACRQDLEIFHRLLGGRLPQPVFDTQVAAMVCGFGEEVSYETLVAALTGSRIDKAPRFADWTRRPLPAAQLRYALDDVIHLRTVYERLHARVLAMGRLEWVHEELATLLDPALYEQRPEDAWQRLRFRSREPRFVALVQALAAWRERRAQQRDVPRNRILPDDLLLELAAARPRSPEELRELGRIQLDRESAAEVLALVREVLARPESALPHVPKPRSLPPGVAAVTDLLRVLLKSCAEEHEVAARLIATTSDLEKLAVDQQAPVPALRGWRRQLFGERALALIRGRLALAVAGRRIRILELDGGGRA